MLYPRRSVSPTVMPGLIPPPASQIVKQWGWWSRPRNFEPSRASFIDVRPNSPPQTTRVSSSRPRRLRSVKQGRDRPVDFPALLRQDA